MLCKCDCQQNCGQKEGMHILGATSVKTYQNGERQKSESPKRHSEKKAFMLVFQTL